MASAPMLDPMTAGVLRQAMGAAQAGDFGRAAQLAETALVQGGDRVALNAFLGMLRARSGDPAGAVRHLRVAHDHRREDTTIACNLIAAMIESDDKQGALDIATQTLALADPTLRIARYRGFLAQSLDRFEEAVEAYEHVVARAPDDFESWNNLGNAKSAVGNNEGSVAALKRAVVLDPEAPPTRLNLAVALRALGEAAESEAVLRKAAEDFPDDARPLHELYVQYKKEARQDDALPVLEEAIARDSENANLQLKFGIECGLVNRTGDAERAFRKAIALDKSTTDAYVGLAVQFEHTNREHEFAPLISLAEANGLEDGPMAFLSALEQRRAGNFQESFESLAKVPPEIEPERTAHLRGTLLDRMGRTDEAFAAFTRTNVLHEAALSDPLGRAAGLRDQLRTEVGFMTRQWADSWQKAEPVRDPPAPVFLVGFPRSGTTLLDTILMGHPGVTVMEEQPPLNYTDKEIGGLAAVPEMGPAQIAEARAFYFNEVRKVATLEPGKLLIDKSPLFLNKAALAHRLFPDARFILALRHPCDVLLSCFMSNFRLNTAMSNFLRLEDAADFYDLNFRHWEQSRALFGLKVHTIVYERLIEDVEGEVRPLFDFLGLDWHDAALDHRKTALSRGLITTASYSQVTEPIYKRAAGRWERYRKHLEPIFPKLAPWIEKFGYSL